MMVVRIAAGVAGGLLVLWTVVSAIQTVVVPRDVPVALTRIHFRWIRRVFEMFARSSRPYVERDRILALYSPVALVLLPAAWIMLVATGFTGIFWAGGVRPLSEALIVSGSSLLTLGFARPDRTALGVVSFIEAGLGLGLVSLLISYLPSIYSAYRTRESLVGMLEVRAGSPPTTAEMLTRYARIGRLGDLDTDLLDRWEQWFVDVEESHTSQPSLVFFRSPTPNRSWITAAGCVLDTAAVVKSTLDLPRTPRADILIRTGFLCLRRIADFYGIPYDPDPAPTDPISVTRREFDLLCVELEAAGLPLKADRDRAWRDFAGWRVNYDTVLLDLCAMVAAPWAKWSSDRMPMVRHRAPLRTGYRNPGR